MNSVNYIRGQFHNRTLSFLLPLNTTTETAAEKLGHIYTHMFPQGLWYNRGHKYFFLTQGVSEWLLFNANSAIYKLYHGVNKLIFNGTMMRFALN
jgi:hypothetical protein